MGYSFIVIYTSMLSYNVFNSKFNQLLVLFIVLASLIHGGNLSTWRNIKFATCHPHFHNFKAQPIKLDDWFWQPCWIWNWHQKQKLVVRSVNWLRYIPVSETMLTYYEDGHSVFTIAHIYGPVLLWANVHTCIPIPYHT